MAPFVLFILTFLFLSVEIPVGRTQCNVCESNLNTFCTPVLKHCTDQPVCFSVQSSISLSTSNIPTVAFSRTCVDSTNNVTGNFYFDFGNKNILNFASEACSSHDPSCIPALLNLPIRMFENGKYCRKCYRTGYDYCEDDGHVPCVGDLADCTEVNGEIVTTFLNATIKIPFAGKGCVSRSVCNMGSNKSIRFGTFIVTFNKINCYKANSAFASLRRLAFTLEKKDLGPQVAFFFPCILGIFAVKILS